MASDIPQWADAPSSAGLPEVQALGEGQHAEFKKDFPDQLRDVAKVLASFGTSGGGSLYLSIQDNGELTGIGDAAEARDRASRRARGIASSVRPSLKSEILLAVNDEKTVLIVQVPAEQDEPVFYVDNVPYVRDGGESRPATPAEVKEDVWDHPSSEHKRWYEEHKRKMMEDHHDDMRAKRAFDSQLNDLFLKGRSRLL